MLGLLIVINVRAIEPGVYYYLTDWVFPDGQLLKPGERFVTPKMQELTLNPDGTFKWKFDNIRTFYTDSLDGKYIVVDDTLILNSNRKFTVEMGKTKRRNNEGYREITVKGTSENVHPIYVTTVSANGDTLISFGENAVSIPLSSKILRIDDAYYMPRVIYGSKKLNKGGDLLLTVTENRTFENEKWIIRGDSIITIDVNGYVDPVPLLREGNLRVMRQIPGMFKFDIEDKKYYTPIKYCHNTKYYDEAKRNQYKTKGKIITVVNLLDGDKLIEGDVLVDSYLNFFIDYLPDNPIRVGRWYIYQDKEVVDSIDY